jgi:hypothetical protein
MNGVNMNIDIVTLKSDHLIDVAEIAMNNYQSERKSVPYLPFEDKFKNIVKSKLESLISEDTGVIAQLNGEISGFIAGYKINELWGNCKGIYCPDYGHGVRGDNRKRIYQKLYKHSADKWVEDGFTHHALTIYAHDRETIDTFFRLGFGLRCVDAMRKVTVTNKDNSGVKIKKMGNERIAEIADMQGKLQNYFESSPIFTPVEKEDPEKYLDNWLKGKNHHLWAAYKDNKPAGFVKIEPSGERFITESDEVMNITGAYVVEEYRRSKIAGSLLGEIQKWMLENDYRLCGVDYESFNVAGSKFWNQFFTPYTYSLVRRIDERVLL